MTNNKLYLILIIIFILGLILRISFISSFPPALNWDEVSHGYNAYNILKTGRDEWGVFLPEIFRAYGDYKLPVYIYTLVPFIHIFGLNEFAVRLPSLLSGSFVTIGIFFLTKLLFKNFDKSNLIALLSSLLIIINPWNFFLSRIAVEANLASGLFIFGVVFLLLGVEQFKIGAKYSHALVFGSVLMGLTMFTYNSFRVFTPIFYLMFIYINWGIWSIKLPPLLASLFPNITIDRPKCYCHVVAFSVFSIYTGFSFLQMLSSEGMARASNISIFDQGFVNSINQIRLESNLNPRLERLLFNKLTFAFPKLVSNYLAYYNPSFWFVEGGDHFQFSVPQMGLFYSFEIVLFLIGMLFIIRNYKYHLLLISWILISPLPAMITRDNPHALRIITLNPIPTILIALGIVQLFIFSKKIFKNSTLLIGGLIIIYIFNAYQYFISYFNHYPIKYAFAWQYGNKELSSWLQMNYSKYDKFYITKKLGEPHEFLAFYQRWDPSSFQSNKKWEVRDQGTPQAWYWINQFQNYYFFNDWETNQVQCETDQKCIIASSILLSNWNHIETIQDIQGNPIYYLSTNK